jgi:hypothetical protein
LRVSIAGSAASFFLEEEQEEGERRDTAILTEVGKPAREISALKQKIGGDIDGKHPEEGG